MKPLQVYSEIGQLRKVLLHRPGGELENLTPKWLNDLLFDDIPWLELAKEEHDAFAKVFRDNGVEVVYLDDLVTEAIEAKPGIKEQFVRQFIEESQVTSETMKIKLFDYLMSCPSTKDMVRLTMAGIRKSQIPNFEIRTLSDHIRDYPFVTDPMPNLYFTRDPFSILGDGVVISKMHMPARSRESLYGDYIFKYHPDYGRDEIDTFYSRTMSSSIEGGDILVLNEHVVAVGVSQRTHPAAIERLAKNLFYTCQTSFDIVLAFDIPKSRSFMHLDTVFTQVDVDKFLIHSRLTETIHAYQLNKDPHRKNKLLVTPIDGKLDQILAKYLGHPVTLIPCGGSDIIASDREQWNDGANTVVLRPGEVIVYERNHITNQLLQEHGVKCHTIPSSELSRGRGGPRCMSMPMYRDLLK
ncbi:MAG: arginine deiminase [Candidatus Izemoplasmatales bacterium]